MPRPLDSQASPEKFPWHTLSVDQTVARLSTDLVSGLSSSEAGARRRRDGPNALPEAPERTLLAVFGKQFQSPLIYLLFAASAMVFLLGELRDAIVIVVVVFVNALIGTYQEGRAERSLRALRRLAAIHARLRRDGDECTVEAADVVRGDVLVLAVGDAVVADARLVEAASLETSEAALTGESLPVAKSVDLPLVRPDGRTQLGLSAPDPPRSERWPVGKASLSFTPRSGGSRRPPVPQDPAKLAHEIAAWGPNGDLERDLPLADRRNLIFAGTHVTRGRGLAVVTETGVATEIGRIAALAEASEESPTPLQVRLDRFGHTLLTASFWILVLILGVGWLRSVPLDKLFMIAVSQIVSLVPEGLPVAMTIALSVGIQRMAARGAIVRNLASVETLGSTSVILTDKTGTLTRNEMVATDLILPSGRAIAVTGEGYAPVGAFSSGGVALETPLDDADLRALLESAVLCNDADVEWDSDLGKDEKAWRAIGDPTEASLIALAMKAGLGAISLRAQHARRGELGFESEDRLMAVWTAGPAGDAVHVKGAPESILPLLTAPPPGFLESAHTLAEKGLRVLAVARVDEARIDPPELRQSPPPPQESPTGSAAGPAAPSPASPPVSRFRAFAVRARFLGLIGQMDPPRASVVGAVARCRAAGIRAVMVTGDHVATAGAVASRIGLSRPGERGVDAAELDRMDPATLRAALDHVAVFARVRPDQKHLLAKTYQECGHVVAMTGDGVNDAPALVRADVGVAMGVSGTEVAKEAADIVVTDDDFSTIVAAVEEGRVVYGNLKKLILYLFSASIAGVTVLVGALALGYPPPFAAVQILWINVVAEGVVTINLILDPPEGNEMTRPPIPRDEPMITPLLFRRALLMSAMISISALGWFLARFHQGVPLPVVQSETFTLLVVCEWWNVLSCRSERLSAFSMPLLSNPWLLGGLIVGSVLQAAVIYLPVGNAVFHTVPIGVASFFGIGACASLVFWAEEIRKRFAGPDSSRRG